MKQLKVAVIGAGSTYTPELMEGFIVRRDSLNVGEFALMDIDRNKLDIVGSLARRMTESKNIPAKVTLTESLEEAVEGADYVLSQIRVGRLDARITDEKIPLKYDLIGQETTGAGGFMKGMRTIPVMINIAKTIERLAPDAWLINFTNPSGMITEAVLDYTGAKTLGLCNCPVSMVKDAMKMLPPGTKDFDYDYVGLNHLSWITAIYADGREILGDILKNGLKTSTMKNIFENNYDVELLKATRGIPSSYLNYYYFTGRQLKHCKEVPKCRGEVCKELEAKLLEMYKDTELKEKPALLEERGGAYYSTAAVSLIDAIENDKNEVHVVNVRNNGALSFMDDNDVIEVKCIVNKRGAQPIKVQKLENPYITGLMKSVKAYEKLAVAAGAEGNYDKALAALMAHPLVRDYDKAKPVLDEMLEVNRDYLPQFARESK